VGVAVLAAARDACTISFHIFVCSLEVGDVTLIPADFPFTCDWQVPPVYFVALGTILPLGFDVIASREAETGKPWDEIDSCEIDRGLEESRIGRRWTDDEERRLMANLRENVGWAEVAAAMRRTPTAIQARARSLGLRLRLRSSTSSDEGEEAK
jgi:hypothetical protein